MAALIDAALTQTANHHDAQAAPAQVLAGLDQSTWMALCAGLGVLMLGAAGSLLAQWVAPVRAWIALVAGIALFIPFAYFIALIVSGLWIIATSISLYRRTSSRSDAATRLAPSRAMHLIGRLSNPPESLARILANEQPHGVQAEILRDGLPRLHGAGP